MTELSLPGCRSEPLGLYLQGLGAWCAVTRLLDPKASAHWRAGQLVLTLTDNLDLDRLTESLCVRFAPVPIVSPWNNGSGFAGNGKSVAAEQAIAAVRASQDPRLSRLRAAVLAADAVVAEGRRRGWGGAGGELWDKTRKAEVVALCRNLLPDDALPWIDAAIALTRDDGGGIQPAYNRLLGTGGNFGRQELSVTYIRRALAILDDPDRSLGWLRAALSGDETVPYLRDAVGQFDPGRAGGVQSSVFEKADDTGFANPWSLLLLIEGTLLFASAVVRRHGALTARAALPFVVGATTAGFASSASGEDVRAEIWTPEWDQPARLSEIEHLLGEGRADWGKTPARSGLDFVRAVSSLGVDRGIVAFTRHVVADRHGQNPLAVPAGRITVQPRPHVNLLGDLDWWLDRLRGTDLPQLIGTALRAVDQALYRVATLSEPATSEVEAVPQRATAIRELLVALGRLHVAVSRSGAARDRARRPLRIPRAAHWWAALAPDTPELRIAGALAGGLDRRNGRDDRSAGLRALLTPVAPEGPGPARLRWTGRPPVVPGAGTLTATLAAAHRRRALPGVVEDPYASDTAPLRPAITGTLSAFHRSLTVPLVDLVAFVTGRLDEDLLHDYLHALILLDWTAADLARASAAPPALEAAAATNPDPGPPRAPGTPPAALPPILALLLPFYAVEPLHIRIRRDAHKPEALVLRPASGWAATLQAARITPVAEDAVRRLRAAGIHETITAEAAARMPLDPDRLSAALLIPVTARARQQALRAIAALPDTSSKPATPIA